MTFVRQSSFYLDSVYGFFVSLLLACEHHTPTMWNEEDALINKSHHYYGSSILNALLQQEQHLLATYRNPSSSRDAFDSWTKKGVLVCTDKWNAVQANKKRRGNGAQRETRRCGEYLQIQYDGGW